MKTSIAARAGRLLGRTAAVGALALLLGGLAAAPVGAYDRDDGVAAANRFIDDCFRSGGTPFIIGDSEDEVWVTCVYPDGTVLDCRFWPQPVCISILKPPATGGRGDVEGPLEDGEVEDRGPTRPPLPNPTPGDEVNDGGAAGDGNGLQAMLAEYGKYFVDGEDQPHKGHKHDKPKHSKGKHGKK